MGRSGPRKGGEPTPSPVLTVLARLAVTTGPVRAAAVAALQLFCATLSVRVDDGETVTWTASLPIPAREGRDIRVIGPVAPRWLRTAPDASVGTAPRTWWHPHATTGEVVPSDDELSFIEKALGRQGSHQVGHSVAALRSAPSTHKSSLHTSRAKDAQIAKDHDPGYVDSSEQAMCGTVTATIVEPTRPRTVRSSWISCPAGPTRIDDIIAALPQPIARRRLEDLLRRPPARGWPSPM